MRDRKRRGLPYMQQRDHGKMAHSVVQPYLIRWKQQRPSMELGKLKVRLKCTITTLHMLSGQTRQSFKAVPESLSEYAEVWHIF